MKSIASSLESDKRIIHYLERILYAANKTQFQNEYISNLIGLLSEIFPKVNIALKYRMYQKPRVDLFPRFRKG